MDRDHCFIAGPDTYFYVVGHKEAPCRARFTMPQGWKVGTGLERDGETYAACDYDTFIDCPTELGKFDLLEFVTDKATYQLVIHAKGPVEGAKLVEMCRKIVREQNRIFGAPPFLRYVFLYHFRDGVGGRGLEHLNSTDIMMSYNAVRSQPLLAASVTSHEYFHLWNVKRIRPKELGPFDYTQPVRSKALWLCEGVTSYYGDLTLARAGVWTREVYLNHLAAEVTQLQDNPARKTQSVEESSQKIWDRARGDMTPSIDYYNKGELLGWLLDLKIRAATEGKKSFDDVMRLLYQTGVVEPAKAGRGPIGVGFEENGILKAVNEVSGADFTEFFSHYVSGKDELPYGDALGELGLTISVQKTLPLNLVNLSVAGDPPAGSDAKREDVRRGDKVVKVGDTAVAKDADLATALEQLKVGDRVTVQITRKGEKDALKVELPVIEGSYAIGVVPDPTAAQKTLLQGWLAPSK
jgi:predicted metalloprotease with PDZ domain